MVGLTILGYWHCCQHYSTFVRCLCDVRCKWMRTTNFTKRSNYMMMTIKYKLSKWCLKHKTPRRAHNLSRMMPSTSRCQMGVKYVPWWVFSQSVGPHSSVTFYFTCKSSKMLCFCCCKHQHIDYWPQHVECKMYIFTVVSETTNMRGKQRIEPYKEMKIHYIPI